MIIKVSGLKKSLDKETKAVKGLTVCGVITVPDVVDPMVVGDLTFDGYFYMENLQGLIPEIGKEYEVVFTHFEYQGEYTARPHHLKEV